MLDAETRRRIDTARDLLVGKVPDPKSQVEQITIALIYKFMDDMDAESEEFGGTRTFFAGDFARFGWARLMRSGLGGHETLDLYAEAITRMPENPGIPPLFRDIFKNAFLPYRDPETLRGFLRVIDEFTYDHSERLGDAFEYLLSVLGSQGDAGQFRTPRHIIDFTVAVLDPQKNETLLDPACGTAGFLISSYTHILRANTHPDGHRTLTPDERSRLATNFRGYDISPDMVRLSLANMYLHGFAAPHIFEYDTLTSQDRWNEYADVILANPPFMSPKGGIRPHNRFSVQSRRSEVLFVDYMAEHLTPSGRAGIIVPEGIIFQSQTAYKQLRKLLVEDYLVAVVSLPAGVFQPYSGVKTSILILDKGLAKKTDRIAFFKVENDGFDLGAQRRPIDKNDLPQVQAELGAYLGRLRAGEAVDGLQPALGLIVEKAKIAANGEYGLSGERYRETLAYSNAKWPLVAIQDICVEILSGGTPSTKNENYWNGDIPWITSADIVDLQTAIPRKYITRDAIQESATNLIPKGNVIVVTRVGLGKLFRNDFDVCISQDSQGLIVKEEVSADFLVYVLKDRVVNFKNTSRGSTIQGVTKKQLSELRIPLPPLEMQKEIVAEIEGYQKVIDGARAVVENYRPQVQAELGEYLGRLRAGEAVDGLQPAPGLIVEKAKIAANEEYGLSGEQYRGSDMRPLEYFSVKLSDVCEINPQVENPATLYPGSYFNYIDISCVENESGRFLGANKIETDKAPGRARRLVALGDILLSTVRPNLRAFTILTEIPERAIASTGFAILRAKKERLLPQFLIWILRHDKSVGQMVRMMGKGSYPSINQADVESIEIPLPPLEVQKEIVAEIEGYQKVIDGARAVVENYRPQIVVDPEWPRVKVEDLCEMGRGRVISRRDIKDNPGPHPVYSSQTSDSGVFGFFGTYDFDGEYVTWTTDGANAGTVFHRTGKFNCTNVCGTLKCLPDSVSRIDMRFLAQVLGQVAKSYVIQVGNPKLMNKEVAKIPIPVPPLEIQQAIVAEIEAEQAAVNANCELIERFEKKVQAAVGRVWGEG